VSLGHLLRKGDVKGVEEREKKGEREGRKEKGGGEGKGKGGSPFYGS